MADLVPAGPGSPGTSLLTSLTDPAGGSVLTRVSAFTVQPAVKRMLPWFLGVAALGGAALTWAAVAPSPQRTLYAQLDDSERAGVTTALDGAGISYHIDNDSGALTVDEGDFYKARMLVASNGDVNQKQLGRALDISPPNMAVTLDRMVESGWVERVRSTHDRRAQHIHLTARGRALAEQARRISTTMEAHSLTALSPAERALLIELLRKIAARGAARKP